jgi:cyclopropane fatty-acyl-phospholipid synthase-like methyltransferase
MSELAHWNERFSAPGYLFGTEPNAFLKSQAYRLGKGQTALAIADGEGRNGVFLAEQGLAVRAVDFSPVAIAKARALADDRGVTVAIEQADVLTWTWPTAQFDVVVAIFVQFATPAERPRFFAGIKQALKPGGLLLMQAYRPEQLRYATGGPKDVTQLYTRALLEETFADFAALAIREHDSLLEEGSRHVGMSALIDMVGTK